MGDERAPVAWSGPPDPERGVYYKCRSPKPGRDVTGVVLSEVITGAVVWFRPPTGPDDRGRSLPCTGNRETCEGCKTHRTHAWKGYLACWSTTEGRLFLAEVTREAYLTCPLFEVYKRALRGKVVTLRRNGDAKNSRVTATLKLWAGQAGDLPPAFNVESALERMWFGEDGPNVAAGCGDGPKPAEPNQGGRDGRHGN